MVSGPVRVLAGREAGAVLLLLDVLAEVGELPPGPWVADAVRGVLLDGEGRGWADAVGSVHRVSELSCRCAHAELVEYRRGVEVERIVGQVG